MTSSADKFQVLVLGAGINGLASAVRIQDSRDDAHVTIMADKFSPDTVSDGSGGFWEAFAVGNSDPAEIKSLAKETYDYLLGLTWSPLAGKVKAQQVSGYQMKNKMFEEEFSFKDDVHGYRKLTQDEIARMPGAKDGRFFTTVTIDVTPYLAWLSERFVSRGGKFVKRRINSLHELSGNWDVVVNCTGLGSHQLLDDKSMKPIRGQVFRVRAPWIKHFCVCDDLDKNETTYVLPNVDSVVVGGVFGVGNWDDSVSETDAEDIWTRAVTMIPGLKEAKIIKKWTGLRPGRESLRLEREEMKLKPNEILQMVHNYGHGGAGITIHWGCARRTTEMVGQCLDELRSKRDGGPRPRSKL